MRRALRRCLATALLLALSFLDASQAKGRRNETLSACDRIGKDGSKFLLWEIEPGFVGCSGLGHISHAMFCFIYEALHAKRIAIMPDTLCIESDKFNNGVDVEPVSLRSYWNLPSCVILWSEFLAMHDVPISTLNDADEADNAVYHNAHNARRVRLFAYASRRLYERAVPSERIMHIDTLPKSAKLLASEEKSERRRFANATLVVRHGFRGHAHWWDVCALNQRMSSAASLWSLLPPSDAIAEAVAALTRAVRAHISKGGGGIAADGGAVSSNDGYDDGGGGSGALQYAFAHIRRGDKVWFDPTWNAATQPRRWLDLLRPCVPRNATLYIATDELDGAFLDELRAYFSNVLTADNFTALLRRRLEPAVSPRQYAAAQRQRRAYVARHAGDAVRRPLRPRDVVLLDNNALFEVEMGLRAGAQCVFCTTQRQCAGWRRCAWPQPGAAAGHAADSNHADNREDQEGHDLVEKHGEALVKECSQVYLVDFHSHVEFQKGD